MKKPPFIPVTFIIVSLLLTRCGKSDTSTTGGGGTTSSTIAINGMSFTPAIKSIKKGTIVTWKNTDGSVHTASSDDGDTFNTGNIPGGASASYTTDTVGTFPYHCLIHGTAMAGTLTVTP